VGEVELRRYRREDLEAMFDMDVLCFPKPFLFDLRSMRGFAEARNAIVLLAERAAEESSLLASAFGKILGFVIVHLERTYGGRRGYVVTLDVLPAERRGGIAGLLMAEAEKLAEAAGVRRMELHVYAENAGAILFYERLGYERMGVEAGFYGIREGASLDALVYGKELSVA